MLRPLRKITSNLPLMSTRWESSPGTWPSRASAVLHSSPQQSELDGFTLDQQDIDELKNCKQGEIGQRAERSYWEKINFGLKPTS